MALLLSETYCWSLKKIESDCPLPDFLRIIVYTSCPVCLLILPCLIPALYILCCLSLTFCNVHTFYYNFNCTNWWPDVLDSDVSRIIRPSVVWPAFFPGRIIWPNWFLQKLGGICFNIVKIWFIKQYDILKWIYFSIHFIHGEFCCLHYYIVVYTHYNVVHKLHECGCFTSNMNRILLEIVLCYQCKNIP